MSEPSNDLVMGVGRVEAFSDGVFSVAVTLLVLNIARPTVGESDPAPALASYLLNQWPSYVSYVLAFLTLGSVWVSHHQMLKYFRRVDETLQILNLMFLMFIVFTPFTTGMVAQYIQDYDKLRIALVVYTGAWVLNGLFLAAMWHYARRNGLLKSGVTPALSRRMSVTVATGTSIGAAAIVVSLFAPVIGLLMDMAAVVIYVIIPLTRLFRTVATT
jgi:uncharacterized membrane protein